MAQSYLRTIEFKVKDTALKDAVGKLGKSLGSIDKNVNKINKQFTALTATLSKVGKALAETKKQEIINPKKVSASILGIKRINKLLKEVKVQSGSAFGVDRRKSDEYNIAATQLQNFVREVANGTKTLAANEAGLKRQAAAFSLIAQNSKVASAVYQTAVFAQIKAEQKLRLAQMERIRQQEKLFQLTGLSKDRDMAGFKGAQDMLAMESQISNTVASLTAYKSELQSINSFLDMSSKEYIQIEKAIDRINDRLNSRKNIEKNNLEILKEAEKTLGRTRKAVGGILNRGIGELFGVLGGKRGSVPQLVAGDLGLESIKQMLRFVPLLDKKLKDQIRTWLNYGQVAARALTGVQVGFGVLSKALTATTWVGEAIRGFVEFEAAASKVIWSIEGNMTRAFSLFGRLARELPQLASAMAMVMPEALGGAGLRGRDAFGFLADGSASGQIADALMGGRERRESKRVTKEGPSRIQALQKELDFQQKLLINRNTSAKDYNRIRRATLLLEKEIANELAVRAGQVPLAEQLEASKEFQRFKEETLKTNAAEEKAVNKTLDIETRKNKLFKTSAQHHKRIVNINGENLDIEQRILRVQERRKALESRQANRKAARGRLGENLMLGAGFPLLFGGGVGSVGGGVLGAGAQAMMGGQGFGAQILFSALGQQMDEFVGKISTLGKAFNVLNPDVDAVISSLGETNTAYGKHLEMLKAIKGEGAAMTEATKAIERIIGKEGLGKIKEFGQDATDLGNEWQKVMLRMQSSIADLITRTGILKALSESMAKGTAFQKANLAVITGTASPELQELWDAYAKQNTWAGAAENWKKNMFFREQNEDGSFKFPTQKELKPMIIEQFLKDQKNISTSNLLGKGADKVADLEAQRQKLEEIFILGERQAEIEEKVRNMKKDGITLTEEQYRKQLNMIDAQRELNAVYQQIGQTIQDGIVNAIDSAIAGTKTLGEVASSVFRQLSRQLLQVGVSSVLNNFLPGLFPGKAKGGPVTGGSPYIVGEKGPELFVPGSSGNIVPNNELGGSGANIVVNVDASGSAVEGNEGQAAELGRMLGAAIQAELIREKRPGGLLATR